jgi:hypothetical protein
LVTRDVVFISTGDSSRWIERSGECEPLAHGLVSGGDDPVATPPSDGLYDLISFQPPVAMPREEALAWVQGVLREVLPDRPEMLTGPRGIVLCIAAREVSVGLTPVALTHHEFELLRLLLERQDQVLTVDDVSRAIWGHETFGSRNFVESQVSRLRSKLRQAGAPGVITTLRGIGYVMRSDGRQTSATS